jgi:hypothetical protein
MEKIELALFYVLCTVCIASIIYSLSRKSNARRKISILREKPCVVCLISIMSKSNARTLAMAVVKIYNTLRLPLRMNNDLRIMLKC